MMAKTIETCVVRQPAPEKCILELQVTMKSDNITPDEKLESADEYAVNEDSRQLETLKLIEPQAKDISPVLDNTLKVDVVSIQSQSERAGPMKHLARENGSVLLRLQGKNERLKQLIKSTIFRNIGRVMGLYGNKQKKIIKVLQSTVKCKRDGVPSKRIVQEQNAAKILTEVELMKKLCNESDKVLLPGMIEPISRDVVKYWLRRYSLFSRFDQGIKIDEEGLFSVTPEEIAKHQAAHCGSGVVVDAFTGVGGNAIQFALMNFHVIAIDIDPKRIEYAKHNAKVYGVSDKIDFIVGDFFQLAPTLKSDVVFLSPPWGGPEYIRAEKYDIQTMLQPANGFSLFKLALTVAPSVAYFLPKTVDVEQLAQLSWITNPPLPYEIEKNYVQDELKSVTAYYGKIAA